MFSELKNTKVVVTGGAGFIGSHLTDELVGAGADVFVIDNLIGGKRTHVNPKAKFYRKDIRHLEDIKPIFEGARYVFHVAALPRVVPSVKDPKTSHDINVTGTLNVLLAARDAGVRRVVYSASSSAYGEQDVLPLHEELSARPVHPYGLQKYMGELLMELFNSLYHLETVSLRYFNVYGRRAPLEGAYAQAIGRFLKQKALGQPLTIVPDGNQTRDFTHVADVVRANILAALSDRIKKHEVINVGGGRNYSVLELADMIGGERVFIEPRIEAKHSLANVERAKRLLGWEPTVALPDALLELKNLPLEELDTGIGKDTGPRIVMVSGGFDPLHVGHLRMFEEAKKLGDQLVVVLNCDAWLMRKKGKAFMNQEDRARLIQAIEFVDDVYILETERNDVGEAIERFKPHIFANGGDRQNEKDIPEAKICDDLGVEMVFNVGGGKVRSSSELLRAYSAR